MVGGGGGFTVSLYGTKLGWYFFFDITMMMKMMMVVVF